MSAPLDPYQVWLGIPPAQQPANHYQLLGISLYERDPMVISAAAQQRIALVHRQSLDGYRELAQQIASELTVARNCLLNTDMKAQYDARLQAAGVRSTPSPPPGIASPPPNIESQPGPTGQPSAAVPRAIPVAPKPAEEPAQAAAAPTPRTTAAATHAARLPAIRVSDAGPNATAASRTSGNGGSYASRNASARGSQIPWIVAGCGLGLVLLVSLVTVLNPRDEPQAASPAAAEPTPTPTPTAERRPSKPAPSRSRPSSKSGKWRGGTAVPSGPHTLADLVDGQDDGPVENNTVTGQLTAARRAMSERKLDAAYARLHGALELARSPFERQEAERVGKLLESLETFWRTVQIEADRLRSMQELKYGNDYFMVSEAQGGVLTIRHAGQFHRYTPLELPPKLAIAVATRRLKADQPETHLHIGSMLAMDARGDRQAARKHWEQAGPAGAALLPELELPLPVAAAAKPPADHASPLRPGPMVPNSPAEGGNKPAAVPAGGDVAATRPTDTRLPVPKAETLGAAENDLRELFRSELQAARDSQTRAATARRLADVAEGIQNDPAARYAGFRLARQLAEDSYQAETICAVIDQTGRHYQIDPLAEKSQALLAAWQDLMAGNQRLKPQQLLELRRGVVTRSLEVLNTAMAQKDYVAADRVCRVALAAARIVKDYRSLRQFEAQADQIKAALRAGQ